MASCRCIECWQRLLGVNRINIGDSFWRSCQHCLGLSLQIWCCLLKSRWLGWGRMGLCNGSRFRQMRQLCSDDNVADLRWTGHGGFLSFLFDWFCLVCPRIKICVEKIQWWEASHKGVGSEKCAKRIYSRTNRIGYWESFWWVICEKQYFLWDLICLNEITVFCWSNQGLRYFTALYN